MSENTKYTDLSNDRSHFAQAIADQENKNPYKHRDYTAEQIQNHDHLQPFLQEAQDGDVLQYFVWDGGFLRHAEGYLLVRNGEQVSQVTARVG